MPPKTSDAVRETIVQWLKVKENFLLITGAAGFNSAVVSGQKLKKKDAYEKLAQFVLKKYIFRNINNRILVYCVSL